MLRELRTYLLVGLAVLSATLLISFNYWKTDAETTRKMYREAMAQIDELQEAKEDNELQIKILKDEKFQLERQVERYEYGY